MLKEGKNINNSNFILLSNKRIIEILNGDKSLGEIKLGEIELSEVRMPRLSGPDICGISMQFGLPQKYGPGAPSRWQFFENLINHCVKNNKVSELLVFLFNKSQFQNSLDIYNYSNIELLHKTIVKKAVENINTILYFSNNELVEFTNCYVIRKIGTNVKPNIPKIKNIDREFIKTTSKLASESIDSGDFDSAITKSRTLIEEVLIYVLESEGIPNTAKGNINNLYNQVTNLLNMKTGKNVDKRINTLLSGLNSILTSIVEMRNINSDSHGVGSSRITISDYQTRLFVNSAMTMSDFILAVYNNQKK